jgi:hypothetical protein
LLLLFFPEIDLGIFNCEPNFNKQIAVDLGVKTSNSKNLSDTIGEEKYISKAAMYQKEILKV